MKSKKLTYLLIVIVAGLWGLIIYRVLGAVSADHDTSVQAPVSIVKEAYNDFSVPKDTAKLLLNYPDPFGATKERDTVTLKPTKLVSHSILPVVTKPAMNWSFITYSGYIRNPSSKKL